MVRTYAITTPASGITVAGATTLVYLRPSATVAVSIIEVRVAFDANATSAMQDIRLVRQAVSGSPASTTFNPVAIDDGNTQACSITGGTGNMAAGTAGYNVSTESGGARTALVTDAFNHLTGFIWTPGPDGPIRMAANSGSIFGVWFPNAPATLTNWHCTVTFMES